jgi:predicted DNA-binding transcriptional regulator YafY
MQRIFTLKNIFKNAVMPQNKDFALRTEIIDECFRNRQRKWTLETLVEAVNSKLKERYGKTASKRTIQNDIKYLIEEKDAPIKKDKAGAITYFFYAEANFSIKNLPVQEEEISLLKDAINILSQVNEFQILREVEDVIRKLQNTANEDIARSPAIIQFEKHTISIGTDYISDIFTAIKSKVSLRISYQSFKATEPELCVFHPYLLKEYRNRWFLIGRKEDATFITNFALDRIKSIKNSAAEYIDNNLFDTDLHFNNLIGVTIPEKSVVEPIDIKVSANQAPYIKTKPIHYTQEIIKEYKNGDIAIRLWLINNYELRSVLLSYGQDVEVIKPNTLRVAMKNIFEMGNEKYK